MTTNYKILGQELNRLVYTCPENSNTIISKLKIKNTSYPANIDVNIGPSASFSELPDSFNPDVNDNIFSTAIQSDGKILLGGNFTTVGGVTRNRIARLNSDGTLDTGFNPNANSVVNAIAIQSDGKILIGGDFTTIGGTTRNRIARLNSDGTLDTGFNPNANSVVNAIAIQSDGKILIGGAFSTIGGVTRNNIARLNSDGTLDTGFNPNANSTVRSINLQPDTEDRILIAGSFGTVGGSIRYGIAKLNSDGTLYTAFNANLNNTGEIFSIAIQPNNQIIIGGLFTTVGGVARNRIARLNTGGTLDTSFNASFSSILGNFPNAMYVMQNNKILLGGNFTEINGTQINRIARLNSDGTLDTGFNPNIPGDFLYVYSIYVDLKNNILIAGLFNTVGGVTRNNIARLSLQSTNNSTYIVKNKEIDFDETIEINGGIALEEGQVLLVDTPNGEDVIIQAYGIEETI